MHNEKKIEKFACKPCFVKFFNNIKFYNYVREKHTKKFKKHFLLFITVILFTSFVLLITLFIATITTYILLFTILRNLIL